MRTVRLGALLVPGTSGNRIGVAPFGRGYPVVTVCRVSVKVQVTCSPALTSIAPTGLPSSHTAEVRSHPEAALWLTE